MSGETWVEWGVRRTWGPAVGEVAAMERDYRTARKCAKDWPGELVHRVVIASEWRDGDKPDLRGALGEQGATSAEETP